MPPAPPRLTLVVLNSKKRTPVAWYTLQKHLLMVVELCNIPLRRPIASNNSFLKCSSALCTPRCSLVQGTVLREVLKQQEEHPWRDEGCSRDTLVERIQVPLSTSTPPNKAKTCSQFSYQAPPPLQISDQGCLGCHCWWLGYIDWFGSRGTGGGWGESRSGADMGDVQAGGKGRVLEGLRALLL